MSSNQKHTVSTDALDTLGTCPIPEGSGRDAIHLAVEPVVCGPSSLVPGQPIKIVDGVAVPATSLGYEDATGIVDPFLDLPVRKGDRFWLVVMPRTITSLRHVWSHPAFPEAATYHKDDSDPHYGFNPEQSMAMAWMKDFCRDIGERYDYVMNGAKEFLASGAYLYGEQDSGNLEGVNHLPQEFWEKYQTIVGSEVPVKDRQDFFTCSC